MTELSIIRFLAAASLAALASCAAPKAVAVVEEPKNKKSAAAGPGDAMPEPFLSRAPQDKIRLGDNFLSMPGDTEFRATVPTNASASNGGVIVRPPSDPVIPPDIGPKDD